MFFIVIIMISIIMITIIMLVTLRNNGRDSDANNSFPRRVVGGLCPSSLHHKGLQGTVAAD